MTEDLHELAAPYSLDALSGGDRTRFEEHLGSCEQCRAEVASFREAVTGLAFAAAGPPPPAELRELVLAAVRAEPQNVVRLSSRRSIAVSVAAAIAVAATAAAVAVGVWAESVHRSLQQERAVARVLGDPQARRISVQGATGSLIVASGGRAALAVALPTPPSGKTYEAWVIDSRVHPAGLFAGRTALLDVPVGRGAVVKVTLEPAGGVPAPTTPPLLSARV